jgi:hypothetical protein
MGKRPTLTTTTGNPVPDNQNAVSACVHGPVLLQHNQLLTRWQCHRGGTKAQAMRRYSVVALFALAIVIPAKAGTPADLPAPPLRESLDALQHHQPTNESVLKREVERYGQQKVEEQQRREQSEVDEIYDDVMRFSAPVASAPPPKSP